MRILAVIVTTLLALSVLSGCGGGSSKVVTTSSGLKYEDITLGTGAVPRVGDTLSVHFTGWLSDGTQFDSTLNRSPVQFILGKGDVIKGWEEGVATMRLYGQRELTVPPSLGYGAEGLPPKVPRNATLIYHIQLVGISPPVEATTPSGLKYTDIIPGEGPSPHDGDKCIVDYTGWLEDGTKFDSSLDPGRTPFEFVMGAHQVIAGWEEGISTMQLNGTRRLVIPPNLAYGEAGVPPTIPPNATLTFQVHLINIIPAGKF